MLKTQPGNCKELSSVALNGTAIVAEFDHIIGIGSSLSGN